MVYGGPGGLSRGCSSIEFMQLNEGASLAWSPLQTSRLCAQGPGGAGVVSYTELFHTVVCRECGRYLASAAYSEYTYFLSVGIYLNCLAYLKTIGYKLIPFK